METQPWREFCGCFRIFSDFFTPFGHEKFPAPRKLLYMVYEHASPSCSCLQLVALNCTKLQVVALRTRESRRFQHHKTPLAGPPRITPSLRLIGSVTPGIKRYAWE